MGSGASKSLKNHQQTSLIAQHAARASCKLSKNSFLYKPIYRKLEMNKIKGTIVSVVLADVLATSIWNIFDNCHAFLVFQFSSGQEVRTEISAYLDGCAIYIERVTSYSFDNAREFNCTTKGLDASDIIDWAEQYYRNGNYNVEHRNCYDYVAFALGKDFGQAQEYAKKWKRIELQKVPSIIRD